MTFSWALFTKDVYHPETKELLVAAGEIFTEQNAKVVCDAGIKEVEIRSVLGCVAKGGVYLKCYGRNLATGNVVELGEAVGGYGCTINVVNQVLS